LAAHGTKTVYTYLVKNVTISLNERLLELSREYAKAQGKSFNEFIRDLLSGTVEGNAVSRVEAAFAEADRLNLRLEGEMPSREERLAR
jgi:hypothetical protein